MTRPHSALLIGHSFVIRSFVIRHSPPHPRQQLPSQHNPLPLANPLPPPIPPPLRLATPLPLIPHPPPAPLPRIQNDLHHLPIVRVSLLPLRIKIMTLRRNRLRVRRHLRHALVPVVPLPLPNPKVPEIRQRPAP